MESLSLNLGPAEIGQPIAEARVKVAASAPVPVPVAAGAAASAAPAVVEEVDDGLTGFDALARDTIKHIGGPDNVRSVLHCITRVRFYLKEEAQADDEVVANLDGVIDGSMIPVIGLLAAAGIL